MRFVGSFAPHATKLNTHTHMQAEALSALVGSAAPALVAALRALLPAGADPFYALSCLLIIPTVLLPDLAALSSLGALSVAAALAIAAALAALFCGAAAAAGGALAAAAAAGAAPVVAATLPKVIGVVAFVFAGHSTFPVLQQSMKRPSAAPRVLVGAYAAVASIATLVGALGYGLYGAAAREVVAANLPAGTAVAAAALALAAVSPLAAFAVTLEPVALALQRALAPGRRRPTDGAGAGTDSSSSGSDAAAEQPPYSLRASVRLGENEMAVAGRLLLHVPATHLLPCFSSSC